MLVFCLPPAVPFLRIWYSLYLPSASYFSRATRNMNYPPSHHGNLVLLQLIDILKKIETFSHTQETLHALAKILAKCGQTSKLRALVDAINTGKFINVAYVSFMDRMRWYAAAGDLNEVTGIWHEWRRTLDKHPCTESYNILMKLCVDKCMDVEAVKLFSRMTEEGALPNCRTYTVIILHLVKFEKLDSYSVLVQAFTDADKLEVVKILVNEMRGDRILPCRAMLFSLERMKEAGYGDKADELIKEMMPDERIKRICYSFVSTEDDADVDDEDEGATCLDGVEKDEVQLKPWLDPSSLASALKHWDDEEVVVLENANFMCAWEFFCWVARQPRFVHDIYTVSRMVAKLARHGCVHLVDQLLLKLNREGMKLSFSKIRLVIDYFGFLRRGDAALNIFLNVKSICGPLSQSSQLILYSSLLRTLAKCQMNSEAFDILEEMMLQGICPNVQTFSGLMHHYALQGDIKTVQRIFGMVRQCDLEPDAYMYKILICAYCLQDI
ncbi:hypothetical protein OROGR_004393 [Orobanche gracilis]